MQNMLRTKLFIPPMPAQTLLENLERAVTDGGRTGRLIEVYILQALAYRSAGQIEQALDQLGHAIALAQPEGFVRLFVDEGSVLIPLLKQIVGRGIAVDYVRQLLPLFEMTLEPQTNGPLADLGQRALHSEMMPNAAHDTPDAMALLLNPLTGRELATLRYLASDLTIPEIAEQMIVAPSTIRTYVKRIYSKLDVHTRIEAVNRARSLALLA